MSCYQNRPTILWDEACEAYSYRLSSCPSGYTDTGGKGERSRGYNCGLYNQPIVGRICEQSSWPSDSDDNVLLSCCMGNSADHTICSPEACSSSKTCQDRLRSYCSDPNNVYTTFCLNQVCGSLMDCSNAMLQYCSVGDNVISDTCSSLRANRPDLTDAPMGQYCSRNPTDPICACLVISDDIKAVIRELTAQGVNFQIPCNLQSCITSKYRPASMRGTCNSQSICIQSTILNGVSQSKFGNTNQTCNIANGGNTTTRPTTTTGSIFGQRKVYLLLALLIIFLTSVFFLVRTPIAKLLHKERGTSKSHVQNR